MFQNFPVSSEASLPQRLAGVQSLVLVLFLLGVAAASETTEWVQPVAGTPVAEVAKAVVPAGSDGMFLPARDGHKLWEQTLQTITADWPVVRKVPPDFDAVPPRAGRIESAWVEPPVTGSGAGLPTTTSWSPQRQRVVVQVLPAVGGAWIDAVVETQSLADLDASLMPDRVTLTGGWETDMRGQRSVDATTLLAARLVPTAEPIYALPPPMELLAPPRPPPVP